MQSFDLSVGVATVFYPGATEERCTAALLLELEVDPVALVRGEAAKRAPDFSLAQYVSDRPYAAPSMLAVALGRVSRSAIAGRRDARPVLTSVVIPLEVHVPAVPCRGRAEVAREMFSPLGWDVDAAPIALDPTVPAWGDSRSIDLKLTGTLRLADALSHLYVLLPVLDAGNKHLIRTHPQVDQSRLTFRTLRSRPRDADSRLQGPPRPPMQGRQVRPRLCRW